MKLPNLTPIQVTVPMVFFQPKPVVLMLSLAFGSALYAPVAMGAESLAGNHKQVNFSAYKGSAGSQPNSTDFDAKKIDGTSGRDIEVHTAAATVINNVDQAGQTALLIDSSGGAGGSYEGNGYSSVGGKGGNGGKVQLQLQNGGLSINNRGTGISIDSHGGHAGNNTETETQASAGIGGAVFIQSAQAVNISTLGTTAHAIAVNANGGNGARGRFNNKNPLWTSMSPSSHGGHGGEVNIQLTGENDLKTNGKGSHAIYLQSNAGDGGEVGTGVNAGFAGRGGKGGNGGKQTVHIGGLDGKSSHVETAGENASAVVMQSAGGNGGSVNSGSSIINDKTPADGGQGGQLNLILQHTDVATIGNNSHGLLLRSEGGFGGKPVTGSKRPGNGGDAGSINVNLSQNSSILTQGQKSDGIHAESLGGSGSRGPNGIFMAKDGGKGGHGKAIEIQNQGSITTTGNQSSAIYAISAGGAAGDGGSSTGVIVSLGGRGGTSGNGGTVRISNTGSLNTSGNESHVVLAQSIGGSQGKLLPSKSYELGGGAQLDAEDSKAALVEIHNSGLISAQANAVGVMAQSIGGGGGNGGGSFGFVSIGGGAGSSGNAGEVRAQNSGTIVTAGEIASAALVLQSIGGGGGYGGKASSAVAGVPTVSIGGKGGGGGNANAITLNQSGTIATAGCSSPSIIAQSIGGGGGMGGASFAVGAYQPLAFSLGGKGGNGGNGGQITLNLDGKSSVLTSGDASAGLLAQSIGGGGGNGGDAFSVQGASLAPVTIGGNGGKGGKGGAVTINNDGIVLTKGNDSFGIVAQSIGGGGGQGGFSSNMAVTGFPVSPDGKAVSLQIAIGGQGGKGNVGSNVTLKNRGAILTQGQSSAAVLLQSIGGGGGNGGSTSTKMLQIPKQKNVEMHIAVGGKGGDGNKGGNVQLTNEGDIRTFGQLATAVMLQSIGGGGGNGGTGSANSYRYDGAATDPKIAREVFKLAATVGGNGGKGNDGGAVNLHNAQSGNIETAGDMAAGVVAQSIGGGGGNGGLSHSDAVKVDRAIELKIGGNGGNGGSGGTVAINNHGNIETIGIGSVGIISQSIGGGGGRGGVAGGAGSDTEDAMKKMNKQLVELTEEVKSKTNQGKSKVQDVINGLLANDDKKEAEKKEEKKDDAKGKDTQYFTNISIGGNGGNGGRGGQIVLVNTGHIATQGNLSAGILSQSIGGGGGDGADSKVVNSAAKATHYDLIVGATGGSGNTGGNISLNNSGSIKVTGIGSDAIIAQSIGGGGGRAGNSSAQGNTAEDQYSLVLGGNGGSGGDAGRIHINNQNTGAITVAESGGHALLVQSIGGGGGQAGLASNQASDNQADKDKNLLDSNGATGKKSIKMALGGKGGAGGHGGEINIDNAGEILSASDTSAAILAQSIGGGGGVGGAAQTENNTKAQVNVNLTLGGSGGKGSDGNKVWLNNTGAIQTTQKQTTAIILQSIGAGGGSAGLAQSDGNVKEKTLLFSLGGSGGDGGKGGAVELINRGEIIASGSAILAQSIGGGGGHAAGADNILNASKTDEDKKDKKDDKSETTQKRSISLAIGGTGGKGGDAGQVNITNTGRIVSDADLMAAIIAQSISGGGGSGGAAVNDNQAELDSSWNLALGGNAGNGKTGGDVNVINQAEIKTTGLHNGAIVAQSIGGGGGSGGLVNQDVLKAKQKAWTVSVGARAGDSGHGGKVSVINTGQLSVNSGIAILGQSIGGGGGSAGLAQNELSNEELAAKVEVTEGKVDVSLGGRKGKEGRGGEVNINTTNQITTRDSFSAAIVGQSIGGGGGHVYLNQAQNFATNDNAYTVGSHDAKGSGGKVSFTHANNGIGHITTYGAGSVGALLQSIGGGGGSLWVKQEDARNHLGKVVVGGKGKESGHGSEVNLWLANNSNIRTKGNNAVGVLAQSIGGGGGYVDFLSAQTQSLNGVRATVQLGGDQVVGDAGNVTLNTDGNIVTEGKNSHALVAQSIGGGGGYVVSDTAANQVYANIGGINAARGNGGRITIRNRGNMATYGNGGYGILAQSIGGGGGLAADTSSLVLQNTAKYIASNGAFNGKAEGNGGHILINHVGDISVNGQNSHAIVAQSIANGGGLVQNGAGTTQGSQKKNRSGDIEINVGDTSTRSKLLALGKNGMGIFAQLSSSDSARGNDMGHIKVKLHNTDLQADSIGINLQGGNANNTVNIVSSNIHAGQYAIAQEGAAKKQQINIEASSSVYGRNTAIKVNALDEAKVRVNSSWIRSEENGIQLSAKKAVVDLNKAVFYTPQTAIQLNAQDEHKVVLAHSYTNDSATAIQLLGSGKSNIEVYGGQVGRIGHTLLQQSSGNAVSLVNSQGWLAGNIDARGKVSVLNKDGHSNMEMGNNWNLNGGKLENKGNLYVAGKGSIGTSYLNGELQQNGSGLLYLDADFANNRNDKLVLTNNQVGADLHETKIIIDAISYKPGASASIITTSGNKEVRFNKTGKNKDKTYKFQILAGDNNLFNYDFRRDYTQNLVVTPHANFTVGNSWYKQGLNQDQRNVAQYLQHSWDSAAQSFQQANSSAPMLRSAVAMTTTDSKVEDEADDSSLGGLYGQMDNLTSAQDYSQMLSNLASDVQSSPAAMMPMHNRQFINKMFSCQSQDGNSSISEDTCIWIDSRYNRTKLNSTFEDFGYKLKSSNVQLGGEYEFSPQWWVGGSLGFEDIVANGQDIAIETNGNNVSGGILLKHIQDPWQWAVAYNFNRGSYDTSRFLKLPAETLLAKSDWNSWLHALSIRGAYTHAWTGGYLRPSIDAILMYQKNPAYFEYGAGDYNLEVAKEDRWTLMLSPQVELAQSFQRGAYTWMPYASVGMNWVSDDNWHTQMRLQGVNTNEWIHVNTELPQITADAKLGLDIVRKKGLGVKLEYNGQWGERYQSHTGRIRLAYQF